MKDATFEELSSIIRSKQTERLAERLRDLKVEPGFDVNYKKVDTTHEWSECKMGTSDRDHYTSLTQTLLHIGIMSKSAPVVELLLQEGADPSIKREDYERHSHESYNPGCWSSPVEKEESSNIESLSALELAEKYGTPEIVQLFQSSSSRPILS